MERPSELVLPKSLQHHLQQVLQLVGLALGPGRVINFCGAGAEDARGLGRGLPLTAAAPQHLHCIQAVPHTGGVDRGQRDGRGWGRTPLAQSWAGRVLHRASTANSIALLAGLSVKEANQSLAFYIYNLCHLHQIHHCNHHYHLNYT